MLRDSYSPNQDIFSVDPCHNTVSLLDIEGYLTMPRGLSEITDFGPQPMWNENYSLSALETRTFLILSRDRKTSVLVRLGPSALSMANIEQYLQQESEFVTGFHVRELGRLGAAIYDIAARMFYTQHAQGIRNVMSSDNTYCDKKVYSLRLTQERHPFTSGVVEIQYMGGMPTCEDLLRESHTLADRAVWVEAKRSYKALIAKGTIPAGVSYLRPCWGNPPHETLRWRSAQQAPQNFSRNDIVSVTFANGTGCLMCLDTQYGLAPLEPMDILDAPLMRWFTTSLPAGFSCGRDVLVALYAQVACHLIHEKRSRYIPSKGLDGEGLPNIVRGNGSRYPVVLDSLIVQPSCSIGEVLSAHSSV